MKKLAFLLPSLLAFAACSPAAAAPPATASTPDAALDQPAETVPPQSAAQADASRIDAALAGSWRDAASRARDKYRHPKETLAFFGVQPGSTVIEITPGGGWYTEVLAPMLKGSGTFIAAIAADSSSEYAQKNNEKYRAKLQQHAADFGDVKLVEFDPRAPVLGEPGSADFVLTFRNVHNWASAGTAPAMFKAFFDVLKPGGVLGVVDHRAPAGAPTDKPGESGYLPTDYVVKLATDAGFTLEAQSEVNANPKDTRDYEKGVWTLPPSLTLGDKDREKYLAIGESDRMTLKFVKPAADRIFHQDVDAPAKPAGTATPAGG